MRKTNSGRHGFNVANHCVRVGPPLFPGGSRCDTGRQQLSMDRLAKNSWQCKICWLWDRKGHHVGDKGSGWGVSRGPTGPRRAISPPPVNHVHGDGRCYNDVRRSAGWRRPWQWWWPAAHNRNHISLDNVALWFHWVGRRLHQKDGTRWPPCAKWET